MSKGEENVSGMIIVVGILIITLLTVGLGISMFGGVEIPSSDTQNISGDAAESELAEISDKCWRKSGKGSELKRIDCFQTNIDVERELEKQVIAESLEQLPRERLYVNENLNFDQAESLRVTYAPKTRTINISRLE